MIYLLEVQWKLVAGICFGLYWFDFDEVLQMLAMYNTMLLSNRPRKLNEKHFFYKPTTLRFLIPYQAEHFHNYTTPFMVSKHVTYKRSDIVIYQHAWLLKQPRKHAVTVVLLAISPPITVLELVFHQNIISFWYLKFVRDFSFLIIKSTWTMTEPQTKKTKVVSTLDQLKAITTIVADTGDFEGKQ